MFLILLKEPGVTLELKRCAFFTSGTNYLGHAIKPGEFKVTNHTVDDIRKLEVPTAVTGLR